MNKRMMKDALSLANDVETWLNDTSKLGFSDRILIKGLVSALRVIVKEVMKETK